MAVLRILDDGQWKELDESGFPCAVSLSTKGLPVFGETSEEPMAWLGFSNRQLFLQPSGELMPVLFNGENISTRTWLNPGDMITIGTIELRLQQDKGLFALSPVSDTAAECAPAEAVEDNPQASRQDHGIPAFGPLPGQKTNHRLRNAVIACFVLLLLSVGFVLIAVPVRITVTPMPDSISLSRFPLSIKIWERYLVIPGTYRVQAEKKGYQKLTETIHVNFDSDIAFNYTLRKLPGLLDISTRPVEGVEVLINNTVAGATPLNSIELQEGSHTIHINAHSYLPAVRTVQIQGMGIKQNIVVELQPGETVQETQSSSHDNETTLKLMSRPSGARVMLNGTFQGHTPLTLSVMPEQAHQLVLSKSGFATATRSVQTSKNTQNITVQLEPEYGIVFIACQPADATLKVDGTILGAAARRLRLTTRPHRLEISKPGYTGYTATVTPIAGVSKTITVQLTNAHTSARKSSSLTTAEGQVLCIVHLPETVTFQMGASRREPGRRSNERQYQVELTRPFRLSEKEVTNAEFRKFRPHHNSGQAHGVSLNTDDQPVTSVTWDDAAAYLNWLSKKDGLPPAYKEKNGRMVAVIPLTMGYRLPTEAEWEFAARYSGGKQSTGQSLKYPWGNKRSPASKSGNYADSSAEDSLPLTIENYTDGYSAVAPVGMFPANGAGLYDLGGNVSEWCHDYYDVYSGAATMVPRDPSGPTMGKYHVIRGSSWRHGSITELRFTYRDYTDKARDDLGFRIARYETK